MWNRLVCCRMETGSEMVWCGAGWRQCVCFCENCSEQLFSTKWEGGGICVLHENVSFLSTPLHITQPINTYIDPVCPDRLTLRYCSCNTYLLHRRAELKAAPGSTWLMWNRTVGNNEPLAVPTDISGVISCVALNERNNWPLFEVADCFVLRILSMSFFSHNSPSIIYLVVTVQMKASYVIALNIDSRIYTVFNTVLTYIQTWQIKSIPVNQSCENFSMHYFPHFLRR